MSKKEYTIFEDKKPHQVDEEALLTHLKEAVRIEREMDVGQREAKLTVRTDYPDLPLYIWIVNDSHLGSVKVDYESFTRHFEIISKTPNFTALGNGDNADHFLVGLGKASTGVYEDAITPEQQALLMRGLFKRLDKTGKLVALGFGNHEAWARGGGYKFENTWLRDFDCPILNCGGLITLKYGQQEYKLALTHRYFGSSRLNITLPAKRFLEFEYPEADVAILGHTHTRSVEQFYKAGRQKVAIVGGTYKSMDEFSPQAGMGFRNIGPGGVVLRLRPDTKEIAVLASPEAASEEFYLFKHYYHSKQGKKPISGEPQAGL